MKSPSNHVTIAGACLLMAGASAFAQVSTLEPVTVTATRVDKSLAEIPAAVSRTGQDEIQLGTEQLGLDEALDGVPGLFLQNRYNFAQDTRASIRGFGARSNFGIRGIKIIVDGIPETLPDGQGSVDGVDIGSAEQISVIRGPASSLYGNASGGAIIIDSEKGPREPFAELRSAGGDFGFRKHQLKFGGQKQSFNYLVNVSDTTIDGYRDNSEAENTQFNGRFQFDLSPRTSVITTLHHTDQPVANDPGGITEDDAEADPTAARDRNVEFASGEALEQTRVGFVVKTQLAENNSLETRVHQVSRDFNNRLPFENGGAVFLDRAYSGAGLKYTHEGSLAGLGNRLLVGIDYDVQDDDRSRFDNVAGIPGQQRLNQNEEVTSLGLYVQNETRLSDRTELTWGLRYDEVTFDVTDRFLSDGDDSGDVTLDQVSPMVGLSRALAEDVRLYATVSTAFETPTTTEFANPNGGGFNQSLEPQQSTNYEIGIKSLAGAHRFEAAIFHIDVEDELTPFELPDQPGRSFFENAGESSRDGIELAYAAEITSALEFSAAYTWSDFTFERFTNADGDSFDGNQIPGVPENLLHLQLSWFGDSGFYATWDANIVGSLFADNANEDKVDGYTVSNLRLGYNGFFGDWEVSPFLGVNNLLDEEYNSNIRINAFGKRYFEPAPERNAYIGVTVRKNFSG